MLKYGESIRGKDALLSMKELPTARRGARKNLALGDRKSRSETCSRKIRRGRQVKDLPRIGIAERLGGARFVIV